MLDVENCFFLVGDAEKLSFSEKVFDGVLLREAISHFRPDTAVFEQIHLVLKEGGSLVITDDRNALNRRVRKATRQIWEDTEHGTREQLAAMGMERSFQDMRRDFIKTRFPALSNETSEELARISRGYLNAQIPAVVESWQKRRRRPTPFAECVNPQTGVVQERLINPLALAKQLRKIGFHVRVIMPEVWRTRPTGVKSLFKRRLAIALWPHTICVLGSFLLVAVKKNK